MSIVDALPKTFTVPELFGCSPTNGIFYSPSVGRVAGKSEVLGQPRSAAL
jgi:hypothetical protein